MQPHRSRRPVTRRLAAAALVAAVVALAGTPVPPAPAAAHPPGDEVPHGVWPLLPRPPVAARFDPPRERWGAGHRGVDLLGGPVALVRTALPGTVRFAGRIAGRGVVVVGHGATRTTYEPVRATVAVGDAVAAGAPIGRLELAGSHCLPAACLHWGWLRGEVYLDPLLLVGALPVRLLPPEGLAATGPTGSGPASPTLGSATLADLARAGGRLGRVG